MQISRHGLGVALFVAAVLSAAVPAGAQDARDGSVAGRITVGGDRDLPPFEFLDDKGRPTGFNVELMQAVARAAGLEADIKLDVWRDVRSGIETGTLDAVCGMFYSGSRDRLVDFSTTHVYLHFCLFVPDGSELRSIYDLEHKKVVVQEGDIMHDFALERHLDAEIIAVPSPLDALRMLEAGKADCALLGKIQGNYLIDRHDVQRVRAVGPVVSSRRYCFAVREGDEALLARLDAGLAAVTRDGTYDRLHEKWLGPYDGIRDHRVALIALYAAVALAILFALAILWSWSLRRKVTTKTAQLRDELAERMQVERAIARAKEEWEQTFDAVPDLIAILGTDRRIIRVNRALAQRLNKTPHECVGMICHELLHGTAQPPVDCPHSRLIRDGQEHVFERFEPVLKGDFILTASPIFDVDGKVTSSVHIAHDITGRKQAELEQRRLEARVQHAQKLESLGVLAGGIAHDFNNLLMGVLGYTDMALADLSPESPARESLVQIQKSAMHAADLTRQMLAYSGKGKFVIEPLDLSKLVEEMAHLLEVSISKKCVLRYSFAPNLPAVEADASQLRQIVMNLITNASEAIGDNPGVISIGTGVTDCDRMYLKGTIFDDHLSEGRYVFLEISDTGAGMEAATLHRIFDPFYTTKFSGRGLGLAAVLGIIRGHNGTIKVYSEPGKGSTFKVLLPASDQSPVGRPEPAGEEAPWRGSGLALVADDMPSIRDLARRVLERCGFMVITAEDGAEAVRLFRERADEFRFVLLDMTMPNMGGDEAFHEMRRIREDVRVILTSGYNEQDATSRFVGRGLAGFIQKPFQLNALVTKVREILGE